MLLHCIFWRYFFVKFLSKKWINIWDNQALFVICWCKARKNVCYFFHLSFIVVNIHSKMFQGYGKNQNCFLGVKINLIKIEVTYMSIIFIEIAVTEAELVLVDCKVFFGLIILVRIILDLLRSLFSQGLLIRFAPTSVFVVIN